MKPLNAQSAYRILWYFIWKIFVFSICYTFNLSHNYYFLFSMSIIDISFVIYVINKITNDNYLNLHITTSGKEAYLANKNMSLLTENIHHEVKTPLVVIQSKMEYLSDVYNKLRKDSTDTKRRASDKLMSKVDDNISIICMSNDICNPSNAGKTIIEETFDMIFMHISAIHNVLDRMQNFKQIRHSNGNKTLLDVVQAAFVTLKLYSKQTFSYIIDPDLKNYHITNLKNEDILNIFINHIKNSLEANSTKLIVTADVYTNNRIRVYMSDNGNGIPNHVVKNIFSANFSTKMADGDMRGIGLWLSKTVLNQNDGDIFVQETSPDGTTFCFEIPSEVINNENKA